jgi:hypothetical protein
MFLLLIGAWVLVNALIDLGAKRVRRWVSDRLEHQFSNEHRPAHRNRAPHP